MHDWNGERCACTPAGGVDVARWNAGLSEQWRRVIQWVRRQYGADVQYFRATEAQKRGALHFHILFRREGGGALVIDVDELRAAVIRFGFGHEVDVQPLEHVRTRADKNGQRRTVGNVYAYVAKYVAKSADQRARVPWHQWKVMNRPATEGGTDTGQQTWAVSTVPTYRTWVASRLWGESMRAVRDAQAHCAYVLAQLDGVYEWLEDCPVRPDIAEAVGHEPRVLVLST